MDTKKLFGYIGLGVISALIIVVVLLSVITIQGKYSPTIDRPTSHISVSTYRNSQTCGANLSADATGARKEKFDEIVNTFNGMGAYTVMQSLFLGLTSVDTSIKEGNNNASSLKTRSDGYLIEFVFTESQTLKNANGSDYLTTDGNEVNYKKLAIFVDDKNEVTEYKVYIFASSSGAASTSTSYFSFTSYSNVKALYDVAKSIDGNGELGWSGI